MKDHASSRFQRSAPFLLVATLLVSLAASPPAPVRGATSPRDVSGGTAAGAVAAARESSPLSSLRTPSSPHRVGACPGRIGAARSPAHGPPLRGRPRSRHPSPRLTVSFLCPSSPTVDRPTAASPSSPAAHRTRSTSRAPTRSWRSPPLPHPPLSRVSLGAWTSTSASIWRTGTPT